MKQADINIQYLRIAQAVCKSYTAVDTGLITVKVFNSKLATAAAAKRTLIRAQRELDNHPA